MFTIICLYMGWSILLIRQYIWWSFIYRCKPHSLFFSLACSVSRIGSKDFIICLPLGVSAIREKRDSKVAYPWSREVCLFILWARVKQNLMEPYVWENRRQGKKYRRCPGLSNFLGTKDQHPWTISENTDKHMPSGSRGKFLRCITDSVWVRCIRVCRPWLDGTSSYCQWHPYLLGWFPFGKMIWLM